MRKETNLKQIFTEITQNTNFKIFTIENSKYIKERRKNSETKFVSNLFSQREQIIIKSRDLLPFNQTSFRTVTHFFQKQNESELISSMITEKVSNNIKKSILNITSHLYKMIPKKIKVSKSKKSFRSSLSMSLNDTNSKSLDNSLILSSSKNVYSPLISNLFAEKKTEVLSALLVKNSVQEKNVDSHLKQESIQHEIMKNLKFKGKFNNYEFNFKNTVKETDNMIQNLRVNKNAVNTKTKIYTHYQKEFFKTARCNDKFFSHNLIELRSNNEVNNDNLKINKNDTEKRVPTSVKVEENLTKNYKIEDKNTIKEFVLKKEKEKFFIVQNRVLSSKIKIKK